MAIDAQRDEIVLVIITRLAAELLVMDFEVFHRPAELAMPAVTVQNTRS
jgi:hypothetical protein